MKTLSPNPIATTPVRRNAALAISMVAMHLLALWVVPWRQLAPVWMISLLAIAAVLSPLLWSLIHEAIHGLLFRSPGANRTCGRLLSIVFGSPFRALRFAHLRHHRYNRTEWGREEVYDRSKQSRWAAWLFHYARITVGLYVVELAMLFACWLPVAFLRRHLIGQSPDLPDGSAGMQRMLDRDVLGVAAIREIRIDSLAVLALYGSSMILYGAHWPWLVGMLAVRALLASQLDHAPHHGTPLDVREYALNMHAPRWIRLCVLNFTLHRVHHAYPHLPWTALPEIRDDTSGIDIGYGTAILRQWRGPIALDEARKIVLDDTPIG